MLKAFQDAPLHTSADKIQAGYFAFLEAYKFSPLLDNEKPTYHLVIKALPEADVEDWAWSRGSYSTFPTGPGHCHIEGGIRLLLAQSKSGFREAIPGRLLSGRVLEALNLAPCTFASFQQASGVFSAHTFIKEEEHASNDFLRLIFRTPQKWECSTGGLATAYNFKTGITTALNLGYVFDLDQVKLDIPSPSLQAFAKQLLDCQDRWSHPLLLPCQFLVAHTLRTRNYVIGKVSHQVVLLEHSVGVTKAGRSQRNYLDFPDEGEHADDQRLFVGDHLQRDHAKKLIASINDLSTWIIFAKRSPQWDIDCANFLLGLLTGNEKILTTQSSSRQVFRETLDYIRNYAEACLEVTQTSEARMQLQLDILYTTIAQDDGQTSARIAASAGKDSTSMKIIALITAAYLPGTFVATLFSMSMFVWQNGGSSEESNVSPDFWVYWAVTIPLTIVTIAGWGIWWKFEEHRFDRDIQQAVSDRPRPKKGMRLW